MQRTNYFAPNIAPTMGVDDVVKATGFDFLVKRSRVRFGGDTGANSRVWDDKHVLFRNDTKHPLAVVGAGYKVVQPHTVLSSMQDFAAAGGGRMHCARVLDNGARYWAMVKTGGDDVGGGDVVESYVALSTSADGSAATEAYSYTLRLICTNGMRAMVKSSLMRISHRSEFDPAEAVRVFQANKQQFDRYMINARRMTTVQMSADTQAAFITAAMSRTPIAQVRRDLDRAEIDRVRGTAAFRSVMNLLTDGAGADMRTARGTLWGALQAITNYTSNELRARSPENAFLSSQFGPAADLNARALQMAEELAINA